MNPTRDCRRQAAAARHGRTYLRVMGVDPHTPLATQLARASDDLAARATPWLVPYARLGALVKGTLYLAVAALALLAAAGEGNTITDAAGALLDLGSTARGRALVLFVGAGLTGYGIYRLAQGLFDIERRRGNVFGRITDLASGGLHLLLAAGAFELFVGTGGPQTGDARARVIGYEVFGWPSGAHLLIALGATLGVGGAIAVLRGALARNPCDILDLAALATPARHTVVTTVRVARIAQGMLFAAMGWFLVRAGMHRNPAEVRGPAGAIKELARWELGDVTLSLFALGLLAIAMTAFFEAAWRRLPPAARRC